MGNSHSVIVELPHTVQLESQAEALAQLEITARHPKEAVEFGGFHTSRDARFNWTVRVSYTTGKPAGTPKRSTKATRKTKAKRKTKARRKAKTGRRK